MKEKWIAPTNAAEAIEIQKELRARLSIENDFGEIRLIAGVDVGYDPRENLSRASVVVMRPDELTVLTHRIAYLDTPFPYVPGLLSFR